MEIVVKMTEKSLILKKQRPDEILMLTVLQKEKKDFFDELIKEEYYRITLVNLIEDKLIRCAKPINKFIKYEDIKLKEDASSAFFVRPTINSYKKGINDWIKEYRDLFPKGMNPNGYPFKGDKKGCINNMAKFLYNYPEFNNKELIIKATKCYLEQKKKDNYAYIAMADRFIWKNDMSTLASYCEQLKEGTLKDEKRNIINL